MTQTDNDDLDTRRGTAVSVLAEALIELAVRQGIPAEKPTGRATAGCAVVPEDVPPGDLIFLRDRASLSTEGERR